MIAVHVTHEAVEKMGGIGAVIAGLVTSKPYQSAFQRTVLAGPLLTTDRPPAERFGAGGSVIYSSLDGIDTDGWAAKFKPIEQTYQVGILYGLRQLTDGPTGKPAEVEVLLTDVFRCSRDRLNLFKGELFAKFGVPCDRFEHIWEFEEYVRLAEPLYEALRVIDCVGSASDPVVMLAHEYMGLPTALKAMLDGRPDVRAVFYAHEVASIRHVIENHPGHDLMFYNLLARGEKRGKALEDFFPQIRDFYKHPLIKAGRHCDAIFAVGDLVAREMAFLNPASGPPAMEVVYNGVPCERQEPAQRQAHRARMKAYAGELLGFEPDYVFTHVARPVLSKGLWRDLRVLHELESIFADSGRTAVFFMLGTLAGQRRTKDILNMERQYGWPVNHRIGYPDLCNGEETPGSLFADFNAHHRAVRVVLVNQFGWERRLCGTRMPQEMSFADIRRGTDVEFGMSLYEPFGISQLEPLGFGAICLVSSVCGCMGFVRQATGGKVPVNVLEADFTDLTAVGPIRPEEAGTVHCDAVAKVEGKRVAAELARRLPTDQAGVAELLKSGWDLARKLRWDRVVEEMFLPAIRRMCEEDEV